MKKSMKTSLIIVALTLLACLACLVELATCKNAESGKTTNWPPAPLTVSGSFVGSPRQSLETKEDRPKAQVNPSSSS